MKDKRNITIDDLKKLQEILNKSEFENKNNLKDIFKQLLLGVNLKVAAKLVEENGLPDIIYVHPEFYTVASATMGNYSKIASNPLFDKVETIVFAYKHDMFKVL